MKYGRVYDANTFDWLHNRTHRNFVLHHSCTYKTELLRQYLPLFLEKQPYDDMILRPAAIIAAKSLVAYDFVLYHYLMDRQGQSISTDVLNKNIWARIKSQKQVIEFVESHPVNGNSSKTIFYCKQLPKMYNYGYKTFVRLPYKEAKSYTEEWDAWRMKRTPSVKTRWIRMYKSLPYRMFRIIVKITTII